MQSLSPAQASALGPPVPCQAGSAPPPPALRAASGGPPVVVADPTKDDWVELELVNERGEPVPGAAFELTAADGTVIGDRLDDAGRIRVEGIAPGRCTVRFPDHDAKPA